MPLTEAHHGAVLAILTALRESAGTGPFTLALLGATLTHGDQPRILDVLADLAAGGDPLLIETAVRDLDGQFSTVWHVRTSAELETLPLGIPSDCTQIARRTYNLAPLRPYLPLLEAT